MNLRQQVPVSPPRHEMIPDGPTSNDAEEMNNTSEISLPSCSFTNSLEPTSSKNSLTLSLYNVNSNEPLQNAEKFNKTGDMIHLGKEELRWNSLYKRGKDIGTEDHQKPTMNNTSEISLPSCSFTNSLEPTSSKNSLTLSLYNVNSNEPLQNAEKFNETGDMIHLGKEELRWNSLYKRGKDIRTEDKQDRQLHENRITRIARRRIRNEIVGQRLLIRGRQITDLNQSFQRRLDEYHEELNILRLENLSLNNEIQQYRNSNQEPNQFAHNLLQ